ncbi:MAG: ADP-ribosylation factor-like protein [Candidatus Hodarchaeales archaeon]|jgi:predicted hydrocarbon binding protein/GTPase SAR1 family protein
MIIDMRIFTLYEEEIFKREFQSYLSLDQKETLRNTIPSLLRIIKSYMSSYESLNRIFSISGIYLHIYLYNEYIFVITTSISLNFPVFDQFIKELGSIIKEILKFQPIFNLGSNSYFINKVNQLKLIMEQSFTKEQEQEIIQERDQTKVIRTSLFDQNKNKYLLMGAGAAGKSSLIAQFFENWNREELLNIKPTVLSAIKQYEDNYTQESFLIRDLAGQAVYRKKHLEDPKNFENLRCLIFVIDVQKTDNFDIVQSYFIDILNKLLEFGENPLVSIFLHKYDPDLREQFSENLFFWIEWLEKIFQKQEYGGLHLNFHLSSILDKTAKEALARTLLFTLPHWFLGQSIQKELIIKSANSLYPLFGQFHKVLSDTEQEEIKQEIYNTSYLFGLEITNELVSNWINYMVKNKELLKKFDFDKKDSNVKLKISEKENKINFCFQCPLKEDLRIDPSVCEITHGLFKGVGQLIGFPNVNMKQTQIRNKSDECVIELTY